ncbi:terpene synthase family protein [Nonomuraea sp. NPDC004702]
MTVQHEVETFSPDTLTCPFPVAIHPHRVEVQASSLRWIEQFDVLTQPQLLQFARASYGELAARVYPYARPPLLQLASDWIAWLFAIDDVICEHNAQATVQIIPELRAILMGDARSRSGFGRALADIYSRVAAVSNTEQLHRWSAATNEYLLAQLWELANRSHHQVPTVEAYVIMRRLTGAMHTVIALIDIAAERPLSASLWADPQVRAIHSHTVDAVNLENDLISWRKERLTANAVNNLVSVLTTHAGLSIPEAFERIVGMREEALTRVVDLSQQLLIRQDEPLTAFIHGLHAWISGALAYSVNSPRYLTESMSGVDQR